MCRGHVAARPQYLMSLCSNGLGEHVGERPERSLWGWASGAEAGVGGGGGRGLHPDGRRGAGITAASLQDGHPVPLTFPLGIAWNACTPWLVVVFLS